MTSLRLTDDERQAMVDGTDEVSLRHRYRAPLTPDPERPVADLPPEPDTVRLADWQDRRVDEEDEDRTLTDEMPAGYCPRVWSQSL